MCTHGPRVAAFRLPGCRALFRFVVLALRCWAATAETGGSILECPIRECLPPDTSQVGPKLCYTTTGLAQSFERCDDLARPHCAMCKTTPPCESWCEAEIYKPLSLGALCHLDRECGEDATVSCYWGVCRRTLWAGQRCNASDKDTVCLFGSQACENGVCQGLGTNEPCWDGYPDGRDLDCKTGWYCLRGVCVPQLPRGHTCYSEHPNECLRGHRCNLAGRPKCDPEYSLQDGEFSSDERLCQSSHVDTRTGECSASPSFDSSGGECMSSADCVRGDGTFGECLCKRWWDGVGVPGYCELAVPDRERPSLMAFREKGTRQCHHNWPEDRCAAEIEEEDLFILVLVERQATADPSLPVPDCAKDLLFVVNQVQEEENTAQLLRPTTPLLLCLCAAALRLKG